ncbi:hypothetical protein SBOR_3040 [Sclerotinia borealis F-4128]|uniref:Protein-tyrosine phosphatase 2 n=1 Tax=Sclerotinia borealis (strain F-4128) TaxID=1432307 RepID=W9CKL0_SCLBF|nr:hypothetical protein SBOR_3040 [Sclerotinia borealis F-4128]
MGILRQQQHSNHTAGVATEKVPLSQRIRICIRQHSPVHIHRNHHHDNDTMNTNNSNNNNNGGGGTLSPSLEKSQSRITEMPNQKPNLIFQRRSSTSDKLSHSVSTASATSPSPFKRQSFISPMNTSLTVKTDFASPKQKYAIPHFLNFSTNVLGSKFMALRNYEQTLRIIPNTLLYHPVVLSRNRYSDVYPWEHHRIKLHSLQFGYINASPIALRTANGSGSEQENFIATQGPRDNGYDGGLFWEMCWQEMAEVVVMLTRPVEEGKEKCGVYYAEDVGEVKKVGEWEVKCVGKEEEGGTVRRTLKLRRVGRAASCVSVSTRSSGSVGSVGKGTVGIAETIEEGQLEQTTEMEPQAEELQDEGVDVEVEVEERTIHHFLFESWPDNDIPQSPADIHSLLSLIDVSRTANNHSNIPRIIHCSAGVGRTGTFIALDHLLRELDMGHLDGLAKDKDPVFETVKKLRDQRMLMVHRVAQFAMIYSVLKEKWLEREMERGRSSKEKGKEKEKEEQKDKEKDQDQDVEVETPGGGSTKKRKLGDSGGACEDWRNGEVKFLHK